MAIVPDRDLQSALNDALHDAFPNVPTAWENVEYVPTLGTTYFRVWLLPAESDVITLGQDPYVERQGIFQISIFSPISIGFGSPKAKAAEVVALFKAHSSFVYNGLEVIIDKAWPSRGSIEDNSWYHIPVSVRYRCYHIN